MNRKSIYWSALSESERKLAARMTDNLSLTDEITFVRLRASLLAELEGSEADKAQAMRMVARLMDILTRMLVYEAKFGERPDGLAELNELVRQRLVKAAREGTLDGVGAHVDGGSPEEAG